MEQNQDRQWTLPKNIRQIGTFGDTYKIYVEDFVYTYVHQVLHGRQEDGDILAAVLLGEIRKEKDAEYVFISGALRCDFGLTCEDGEEKDASIRQQEFWGGVYQGIKEYFADKDILGWYVNLDGSGLELNQQLQQFFEATYSRGSRFLYYEDSLERIDAFFVQEQHCLQRISGYAVYYEKNPQMQEYMIAEKERLNPAPSRNVVSFDTKEEDVAQNYRAIMNKLNEKPKRKKVQPVIYVAGVAVLAVVSATGITQIGNYQNLKTLENTLQTLSGSVSGAGIVQEQKTGQALTTENTGKTEQTAQTESADKTDQTAQTESVEKVEQTAQAESVEKAEQTAQAESSEKAEQTLPTEKAEQSSQTDNADKTGQENSTQSEQEKKTEEKSSGQEETAQTTSSKLPDYYVVKKGDSLVSISRKFYNTSNKVKEICTLNKIEDENMILEGQKLRLP